MAVNELDDFRSESIPTRRFHHAVKSEVKRIGSIDNPKHDSNNLIAVAGSTEDFTNDQPEHYDLLHFENVRDFDSNDEKWRAAEGIKLKGRFRIILTSAFFIGLMWCILNIFPTQIIMVFACFGMTFAMILMNCPSSISTRAIKWTLDEFSEEIREYFFTSPTIHDNSGAWRLVLGQVSDEEANIGLIATEIAVGKSYAVEASVEIFTRISGRNIAPGMNDVIKFVQTFQCEGDCGYSTPISLRFEQLKNHKLEIKCRIRFTMKNIEFNKQEYEIQHILFMGGRMRRKYNKDPKCSTVFSENGIILSENKFQSKMLVGPLTRILTGTELEGESLSFMKHPETKVSVWKLPNFSKYLQNVEFWDIFSPKLLVGSHGFCSIWHLQLFELEGVFRIRMQLRGLPRGISKIKIRYLIELLDNCGEFIAPNNCGSTIKYPEHLDLYDTNTSCCLPLYRREAMLERSLDNDDTLNLRISLHCEPNGSPYFDRPVDSTNKRVAERRSV